VQNVPDDFGAVRDAIRAAARAADIVLVSGGTSVGPDDHAPRAAAELGELAVHGVALRPAGPLGVAFAPGPVFLVPGNPVSCLCAYDLFVGRAVRRLGGRAWDLPHRREAMPLAAPVPSATGRVDYVRVKVSDGAAVPLATGGASNLSSAVAADGFVLVPADRTELPAGERVEVWCYE
ncbi:MAG: molybdopterin molybdenumtransferase MoeA, partial [Planctomycetes bacterium]|nr:molybdopterin molybdenumtransferase MoeA [Planctomycetota bacterium]